MGKIWSGFIGAITLLLIVYVLLPGIAFPEALPNSPQSQEPGDLLDVERRRAYFTDAKRADVIGHYQKEYTRSWLPTYRLNYPPEEALWHVYDPLLSSYLEEIVYPFRESLFVNGYEPNQDQDKIAFEGRAYLSKVTVRSYTSPVVARVLLVIVTMGITWMLGRWYAQEFVGLVKAIRE